MEHVIELLKKKKKTISTMESCTGGYLAHTITNVEGSSEVFKFGAVTYSNEFKIKMGVSREVIQKFSVYSMETADEMSQNIAKYTHSDLGVGITGKLNCEDPYNPTKENNLVYMSIYSKEKDQYFHKEIKVTKRTRLENKELILKEVIKELRGILNQE